MENKVDDIFANDEVIKEERVAENEIVKYYKSGKKERIIKFARPEEPSDKNVKNVAQNNYINLGK